MRPDLSVIMPVYNCEAWIGVAIESVLTGADGLLELVVVDDGSTDSSAEIARSYGGLVRVVRQENQGAAGARNTGLEVVRGELIGWLDADDIWVAGIPDPRRAAMTAEVEVVLARVQPVYGEPPVPIGDTMAGVQLGAMLARREVLERLGGVDATYDCADDLDLILRMRDSGVRTVTIDDVTAHYRQRAGSITQDRASTHSEMVRAIRQSIVRRAQR